jgi:hypothetical protein
MCVPGTIKHATRGLHHCIGWILLGAAVLTINGFATSLVRINARILHRYPFVSTRCSYHFPAVLLSIG